MANKHDKNGLIDASTEVEDQNHLAPQTEAGIYEIHVKGHLNNDWSDWLEGLEMKLLENGEMNLVGPIADQSALMGVLIKLNRLNLTLLSVNKIKHLIDHK